MDGMGVGALTSAAGVNIAALKKAIQTEEALFGRILDGASAQGLQTPRADVSEGAKSAAAESMQKGLSLDIMA